MPCDYKAIRRENELRYGTDIGRIGPMLLADRYDDRTHFIYELLQNAEDALARRDGWHGSRAVSFDLDRQRLKVSHYGVPFDERDVAGICGIGESTKDLTAIGRFGIGFKSVYAFTDRPEVHSGDEDFVVESYVWPVATASVNREAEETVILIPLKPDDSEAMAEIEDGLSRLGASSLLFLREIEEVSWRVNGNKKGHYLRHEAEEAPNVRTVTVVGVEDGKPDVDEEWLVCSREVHRGHEQSVGHVEVAWSVAQDDEGNPAIRPVDRARLVVYFPTAVETGLGIMIQGPYRTTPSRDNVPQRDEWNRTCIRETGTLLVESLRWLREHRLLDAIALTCLPLDPGRFEGSMFGDLFDVTKDAFSREDLLPALGGGHVCGDGARLASTQELRGLLDPTQLASLEGERGQLRWVDGQISPDRTPTLRQYLIRVLGMRELTPVALLTRLNRGFLESQSDSWIQRLYEFFGSQPALRPRLGSLPIVRLANGSHVEPSVNGELQAFLPSPVETDFPTVREGVCRSKAAREFLKSMNLTQPDPVDNVIRNILPKYREVEDHIPEGRYSSDVESMLQAAETDSQSQRDKLVTALRTTPWVKAVDAGSGRPLRARPEHVYVATERLRDLFADIEDVLVVDSRVACLRGEPIRELLERCGASRYLQPIDIGCDLSEAQLYEIRRREGLERSTWSKIEDIGIRGLGTLLESLPALELGEQAKRAANLWDALRDLYDRRGAGTFDGTYEWGFYQETKVATFDAAFVRLLKKRRWIPGSSGELQAPESITFDELGWRANGFLESKISFRSPLFEQLAREVGIEPGVLDLLRQLGVTNEVELRQRLNLPDEPSEPPSETGQTESEHETSPSSEVGGESGQSSKGERGNDSDGGHRGTRSNGGIEEGTLSEMRFVSYVGVIGEGADSDPDGLEHAKRMELERSAIEVILTWEPDWRRTPANNAGFDLYKGTAMETATEWCEVKAMTGTLDNRPVGMSRTQFEWARKHGKAYWLYVVERAGTGDARVVRIQDPAGKAMTFTFDRGWRAMAGDSKPGRPSESGSGTA